MTVELKTVNHRFLDINQRLPRALLFVEDTMRKELSARLQRGHVDVFIAYRNARSDAREVVCDEALAAAYTAAYDRLAAASGVPDDRSLSKLAMMPDVLTVAEKEDDQAAVTSLCRTALSGALDALCEMRAREGDVLRRDLSARLDTIESLAGDIAVRAPAVVDEYREKLSARLSAMLPEPPDPWRLAQEVALMADRAAIDEELVRLGSHLAQFRAALSLGEPVGRKLDFLVQELNREVNTIGSKASDLTIAGAVVAIKAEIEKIREQVQNIE